jgi:hypothetical protein
MLGGSCCESVPSSSGELEGTTAEEDEELGCMEIGIAATDGSGREPDIAVWLRQTADRASKLPGE